MADFFRAGALQPRWPDRAVGLDSVRKSMTNPKQGVQRRALCPPLVRKNAWEENSKWESAIIASSRQAASRGPFLRRQPPPHHRPELPRELLHGSRAKCKYGPGGPCGRPEGSRASRHCRLTLRCAEGDTRPVAHSRRLWPDPPECRCRARTFDCTPQHHRPPAGTRIQTQGALRDSSRGVTCTISHARWMPHRPPRANAAERTEMELRTTRLAPASFRLQGRTVAHRLPQ